ncbi:MAG: PIN domain-containing protein [Acidobacteria bacterium]|nr:MAG: PIN domain-containing protein [Acidobacteriota bacterium]
MEARGSVRPLRLVDTNVLVYRHDPRFPEKQELATQLLGRGPRDGDLVLPHQAIVELVSAVSRPRGDLDGRSLLERTEALQVAEKLLQLFPVLCPDEDVVRTACRGMASYQLSWWDAHLWAYAEANGVPEILSEEFEHGRYYGAVRLVDPFVSLSGEIAELPAMYESAGDSVTSRSRP